LKILLKNIANIQTGLFDKPSEKGEVVYLQSRHFDDNGQLLNALHPDLMANSISEKHLLKPGDVLFAAKGTKIFASVYECHNEPAVASTSFFVIRLTDSKVLPEYLAWFLNHPKIHSLLKNQATGTSMPSISKSVIQNLEISIPSIEVQQSILNLAALQKKEALLRNKITILREKLIIQQIMNKVNQSL
jgi:restriction endonuclease S subunit